jgi:hypothetical protein
MRTPVEIMIVIGVLSVSCSGPLPRPVFSAGADSEVTADGLRRLDSSGFPLAWLRPRAELSDYDSFELIYIGATYREPPRHLASAKPGSRSYALPEQVAEDFAASLRRSFRKALTRAGLHRREDGLGSRSLVVRVALIDLEINAPLRISGDEDLIWMDKLGTATVTIDLFDAESRARLGHFAERNQIRPVSSRAIRARASDAVYEMDRICRKWAHQLRQLLEVLQQEQLAT